MKDKKPREGAYLCLGRIYLNDFIYDTLVIEGYFRRSKGWSFGCVNRLKHYLIITHWMPLPKPPEEYDPDKI